MNIIILGGANDKNGILNNFTQKRIIKCYEMLDSTDKDITIHFSGGFNKKFNDTGISHSKICLNYFEKICKNHYNIKKEQHACNNNTIGEAINFGKYFENNNDSNITIITNDWHTERVKYLFEKTFEYYNIRNYIFVGVISNILDEKIIQNESKKIKDMKGNPYGLWKEWLVNNYYDKFLNIRLIEKNDMNGKIIVNMRNENNKYFFNESKFEWASFKKIFYTKYFSNEIPPFFICLKDEIVGFIGCKTVEKDINDIGIMFFKKFQNRGLGKISLKKFLKIYDKDYYNKNKVIIAQILKTNIGSYKIFISNDFKLDENKSTDIIYFLNK